MNILYDKGVLELLKGLLSGDINVIYSSKDGSLAELAKRNKNGELRLPAVTFYRSSGMRILMNEAHQSNLSYQGTDPFDLKLNEDLQYVDTMMYQCLIPYTISVFGNTMTDTYELIEELLIAVKSYPAVKIKVNINIPYTDSNNVDKVYSINDVGFEAALDLSGGGSGVSIDDSSELTYNFGETGGLYMLNFEVELKGTIIKFKVNNKIIQSDIRLDG